MRRVSLLAFLLCLFSSVPLVAQKITGTILGTVSDPSGAAISGATVTARNTGTGDSRTATTNSAGTYTFPEENPGTYDVTIKASNFKEFISRGVTLDVSSNAFVNATLEVGSTTEQVTVEASTVQVETASGAVGNVVEGNEVRELPLNGRNFVELTQLAPGVSPISSFNVVKKGLEGGVDFSVNGNNVNANLFLIDGVNNNDIGSNRTILVYPSIQAIDEFKILRNSYGPEYGQAGGAIINIVTRGGTNQIHGGVFYDGRNNALDANNYFNNLNGTSIPPLHRNDYGFNVGGPIIKDKLFFFESEEWNKEIRGLARFAEVPTPAEVNGDFSNLRPGVSSNGSACDPAPTIGGVAQTAIPAGQLSHAGQTMAFTYPTPNISAPNCINWGENFGAPVPWREDNVRIDANVTPTLKLMGRFTNDSWAQPFPSTLSYWGDDIYPSIEGSWTQPGRQATLRLTKLLGSTAINDFQFSFAMNRIGVTQGGTGSHGMTPVQLQTAINTASPAFFPYSQKFGGITGTGQPLFWTAIAGTQNTEGGSGGFDDMGPWHNNEQLLIYKDDFNKVIGTHTFKVGFLGSNNQKNEEVDNSSGFNSQYWSTTSAANSSGNGVFDLLWNQSTWGGSESNTTSYAQMRWHDYEFYGGDTWKIRRNVTLEYGARYSLLRNAFTGNNEYGNWQPSAYNPALGSSPCNGELLLQIGIQTCAADQFAGGTLGPNRALRPNNDHMIAPRLGIAWDVRGDGKTAIRAGFGEFYMRDATAVLEGGTNVAPFVVGVGFIRPLDTPPAGLTASGTPSRSLELDNKNPHTIQYNLTIERELFPNTKLEVSYVGNKGYNLADFADVNFPSNRVGYALTGSNTLRPFGAGSWAAIQQQQFEASSNYNSLQALFRTRIKTVDAQFAYTFSKSLADTDIGYYGGGSATQNTFLDPLNHHLDYGPTTIDRPHMLVGNIVYNLPALSDQNGFVRAAAGSWELSSILSYASGPYLTMFAGTSGPLGGLAGTGYNAGDRPNRVPGVSCSSSLGGVSWINPAAFTLDHYQLGTDPNTGRGACEGPGNAQTDFSVGKHFKITERISAKFSLDFFNVFNKTQFIASAINTNLSQTGGTVCTAASPCPGYANNSLKWNAATDLSGNFGQNTATKDPREIQYGLKIDF
ncbi:MAG TPA: carboxypeptidase regulatory-like domain-containing protein [Terriglobales bacterium]|jgi:hypothetical protein|nr:carboxypeptidase regulatory-like domain-containing protein [Terriglobales bacterium]